MAVPPAHEKPEVPAFVVFSVEIDGDRKLPMPGAVVVAVGPEVASFAAVVAGDEVAPNARGAIPESLAQLRQQSFFNPPSRLCGQFFVVDQPVTPSLESMVLHPQRLR